MVQGFKHIVGVDEVGRGPLAGPLAVCAVRLSQGSVRHFKGVRDSKQLSAQAREEWHKKAVRAREKGDIDFFVSFVTPKSIDKIGIAGAARTAIRRSLARLTLAPEKTLVLLDGGLTAPEHFKNQKTIIRGDESECAIALASVIAKVTRDARMVRYAKKYPEYGFEKHKGYGTAFHMKHLETHGMCPIHRSTFIHHLV